MSNLSVVLSALAHLPSVTEAHGYMGKPLSRHAQLWGIGQDYEPQSGIWRGSDSDTTCGKYTNVGPLTEIRGSTFDLELYFTANHGGNHHLNFQCSDPPGQWQWLTRASGESNGYNSKYPYEFFVPRGGLPKKTFKTGKKQNTLSVATSRWNSPPQCNKGVLRWSWETSNSCITNRMQTRGGQPKITKAEYQKQVSTNVSVGGCMERYINCADVKVVGGGQPGRPAQEPAQTTMPPISQYPEIPMPPIPQYPETPMPESPTTPTGYYPAQPGNDADFVACSNWGISSCRSAGVAELCPSMCGGGRRLEFDAVYDETDTDELVSLNPSIGRMRGSSYSLPGLDH